MAGDILLGVVDLQGTNVQQSIHRSRLGGVIDSAMTVLLFALGGFEVFALPFVPNKGPAALFIVLGFVAVTPGAAFFAAAIIRRQRAKTAILQSLFVIGVVWAGFVWTLWLIMGREDYMAALWCGTLLAPAYLLVAVRRRHGIGMRAFIAAAVLILLLLGMNYWPARELGLKGYLLLPLTAAFIARLLIREGERPIPP